MPEDIFSRFRAAPPPPPDQTGDGSSIAFRRSGGEAQVREADVLAAIDRVPALPQVVTQILAMVRDDHSSTARMESLIEQDMVIAGRVLKLVNSAFYKRSVPVGSIREAVSIIGFASLRSLVLAASTSNILMVDLAPYGMPKGGLWRNAMATASLARAVGVRSGLSPDAAEEFFAAGLLRDVGLLVLAPFLAKHGIRLKADAERDVVASERRAIGFDHGWVGERLAEKWQLPGVLRACIAHHHRTPAGETPTHQRALSAVRLAERLAYAAGIGVLADHPFDSAIDGHLVGRAGLDAAAFATLCAEVPTLVKDSDMQF
jgi:HD-like signal output (HDOD) protein